MRVLVTGGAGFIGSHTVDRLLARGDEVVVIDDLSRGRPGNLNPAARFLRHDIRSASAAEEVLRERPEVIVHQAAQVSVSLSLDQPVLDAEINILGTLRLIEAARQIGSRFIFASSAAVYGTPARVPTDEDQAANAGSPYGVGKLTCERYLSLFHRTSGLRYAALRYANVYGPRQDSRGEAGVIASFCAGALEGRELVIDGDGRQTRDFVYVTDIVEAIVRTLDSDVSGAFNVGTGRETDVNELVSSLAQVVGSQVRTRHGPPRPSDIRRSALDSDRMYRLFEWRPEIELAEGLRRTTEWIRSAAGVPNPASAWP